MVAGAAYVNTFYRVAHEVSLIDSSVFVATCDHFKRRLESSGREIFRHGNHKLGRQPWGFHGWSHSRTVPQIPLFIATDERAKILASSTILFKGLSRIHLYVNKLFLFFSNTLITEMSCEILNGFDYWGLLEGFPDLFRMASNCGS